MLISIDTMITTYAPVVIPTLNRYEHFKRCIESLEKCTGADKTEVYVGLDYPPSEKYVEGWKKIDEYLKEKEHNNRFTKLIVKRRDHNLGICNPKSNDQTLINELPEDSCSYIFTEDDNEFSPCFLEYMNQNLEKYKDDTTIYRICGYLSFRDSLPEVNDYTQFKVDRYIAWGIGCWVEKEKKHRECYSEIGLKKLADSKVVRQYFEGDKLEDILVSLVRMSKSESRLGDVIVASYMEYAGCRCILPTKSMVRNHGWDGSGSHGGYQYGYKEQEIQTSREYVMNEAPAEFTEDFEREMHRNRRSRKRDIKSVASMITWYLYKYTGVFCEFKIMHDICKKIKNTINGKQ